MRQTLLRRTITHVGLDLREPEGELVASLVLNALVGRELEMVFGFKLNDVG